MLMERMNCFVHSLNKSKVKGKTFLCIVNPYSGDGRGKRVQGLSVVTELMG